MRDEARELRRRRKCNKTNSIELNAGQADAPGFELINKNILFEDSYGSKHLHLIRNSPRLVQTSVYQCRSFRANVDCQLLIFDKDPENCCPSDIAHVVDYVVSYVCRGSEAQVREKADIKSMILSSGDIHGDKKDLKD